MTLSSDSIGLKFTVKPTDTSFARDLIANIKAGVINQCSFAFTVANTDEAQDWEESDQDGVDYERTIRQIDRLFDVSVVTTPAYPDTEVQVGQRSINMVKQMQSQENRDATDQKRKKMLRELERQELLKTLEGGN